MLHSNLLRWQLPIWWYRRAICNRVGLRLKNSKESQCKHRPLPLSPFAKIILTGKTKPREYLSRVRDGRLSLSCWMLWLWWAAWESLVSLYRLWQRSYPIQKGRRSSCRHGSLLAYAKRNFRMRIMPSMQSVNRWRWIPGNLQLCCSAMRLENLSKDCSIWFACYFESPTISGHDGPLAWECPIIA